MKIRALGQAGFIFETSAIRIVIDPYLSDSVADQFGPSFARQIPIVVSAEEMTGVDWILLTHAHLDHTDPATLLPLAIASPLAEFVAPFESRAVLTEIGLADRKVRRPPMQWTPLAPGVEIRAVPAAHPEYVCDAAGEWRDVGYLLRVGDLTLYHAGDTVPHPEIFASLASERIDWAFLPVNERNFYRDREGIIGNMTVREAFQMAADLAVRTLVPVHWDLFAPNRTHRAEIELLHELERPTFDLEILPAGAVKALDAGGL